MLSPYDPKPADVVVREDTPKAVKHRGRFLQVENPLFIEHQFHSLPNT